ncbi:MAG: DNA repair protein RecN, partial [Streptosporangiaceae bacterium]
MLEEVRISGLGVIDEAVLELSPGFNVVTGETGAGKTMVVSGLGLLFGGRADPSRVRPGAGRATVEGRLRVAADGEVARQVSDAGGDLDDDGQSLLLSRSVSAEGRSRAYAGGRSVPVSLLTYLSDDLVAVHGQADQQQLLRADRQRAALDRFAGPDLARVLGDYQRAYRQHAEVRARLDELTTQARERAREAEDLRRGLAEIEQVEPVDGEDIELSAEAERLSNADALHTAATTAHESLMADPSAGSYEAPDALTLLGAARHALDAAAGHDLALGALAARLGEAAYLISDIAGELASYVQTVEADPARLAVVQDRRADLTRLIRSYGSGPVPRPSGGASEPMPGGVNDFARAGASAGQPPAGDGPAPGSAVASDPVGAPDLAAVLAWAKGAATRLAELDGDDDTIMALRGQDADLAERVAGLAGQVSEIRRGAAARFESAVTAELAALAMPHARLSVAVSPLREYGPQGGDDVEVRLAAHPGAPALPLHKGASGGELSRVMLAIEVVFAGA